ncbi:MAG: hypothetical protein KC438_14915, partial [Thermomicrobiales bacterium]|nr:hypothetical protein [Thermomicrobiales bacterium]
QECCGQVVLVLGDMQRKRKHEQSLSQSVRLDDPGAAYDSGTIGVLSREDVRAPGELPIQGDSIRESSSDSA